MYDIIDKEAIYTKRISLCLIAVIFLVSLFTPVYASNENRIGIIVYTNEDFDMDACRKTGLCEITREFSEIISGFAAETYDYNIDKIKAFKGVENVYEDGCFNIPETEEADFSPSFYSFLRGYKGEGALVAVADSSFNVNHAVFKLSDETSARYDKTDIESIINGYNLQAEKLYPAVTADKVYKSAKVPFAFDYAGNDDNVKSSQFHGNGVASVIGGNSDKMKGVLPETQLALMKVATDSGSIYASSIVSAFEDAAILGVDAINLSIGSSAGFSSGDLEGIDFGAIITNMRNRGIFVACSCGNDGMLNAEGLPKYKYGGKLPLALNPDYGIIATPATARDAVAVAAYAPDTLLPAAYSSVGPGPNLDIKPDIIGKGTYYHATVSGYGTNSGTSFSSPEICAKSVIVSKELESRGVDNSRLSYLCENILMSSADIIRYSNDIPVSPRYQGSGCVNAERAVELKTILSSEDGKGKLNLKDNLKDSISFSFYAENLTEETLLYTPSVEVITDGHSGGRITGKNVSVPHTVSFSEDVISLNGGQKKKIDVVIEIDSGWAERNSSVFVNGFYIEGYITLESSGNISNIPFMGFYGDWNKPPVFIEPGVENSFGFAELFANSADPKKLFYLGNSYYDYILNGAYALSAGNYEKISFSPNGDGAFDVAKLYAGLYRNAAKFRWTIKNLNGVTIKDTGLLNVSKGKGINYLSNSYFKWDGKNSNGKVLPDGKYYFHAEAYLDYDKNVVADEIDFPIWIDTQAPGLGGYSVSVKDGREILSFNAHDANPLQIGAVSDTRGNILRTDLESEDGKYSFDITGCPETLLIEAADYANNLEGAVIAVGDEYIAYFDKYGVLLRAGKEKGIIADGKPVKNYGNLTFEDGEAYAKVFIWDKKMKPIFSTLIYN